MISYTEEQEQIFKFVKEGTGHGIIDAVAGAGKTTTIMASASHVPAGQRMLFCAFNNAISKEIEAKFIKQGMGGVTVKTMHALGRQMLVTGSTTGKPPRLVDHKYRQILGTDEMKARLKDYYREIIEIHGLDPDDDFDRNNQYAVKNLLWTIEHRLLEINKKFRATLCQDSMDDFRDMVLHFGIFNAYETRDEDFDEELANYYECHKILLAEGNAHSERTMQIDFTDMLYLPYLWKLSPLDKYDFIFIDECQDLSKSQLAVCLKYGKKTARILSVGDPRQSIYGFTGADIESFDRVRNVTMAKELPLTMCFRCPQEVISLAREIRSDIEGNKDEPGIVERIASEDVIDRAVAGDLIISRVKAPLMLLVFSFINQEIKVQIHPEDANDFIAELRNLFKPQERNLQISKLQNGLEQILEPLIKRREYAIKKEAERITNAAERAIHIDDELDYLHERLDFIHKKSIKWQAECPTLESVFEKIRGYISAKSDCIKLSTIHRAKGLEEKRVFILEYPKLPYMRPEMKDWEKVQEHNLKYVAVTRAKEELYLVELGNLAEKEEEGSLFDDLF